MEPSPHQLVTCPYNISHQVEHHRLLVHLTKCQKQHPEMKIVKCPFNATHRIPADKINNHVESCPQRFMVDALMYATDGDYRPPVPVVTATANFTCPENWDDEEVQPYKPETVNRGAPIYAKLKGATPSERRKFRYQSSIEFSRQQHQLQSSSGGPSSAGPSS